MQSAPAHIAGDQGRQLRRGVGRPRPDPRLGDPHLLAPAGRDKPVRSASVITGTRPAHDTRLSSSNTAESGANLWDTCTGSAFLDAGRLLRKEHQSSQFRRHFPHFDTRMLIGLSVDSGLASIPFS